MSDSAVTVGGYRNGAIVGRSMAENYSRESRAAQKENLQSAFNSDVPTPRETIETLNINTGYLLSILRLIDEWVIIRVNGITNIGRDNPDYFYMQLRLCKTILHLINCKMKPETRESFRTTVVKLKEMFESMFVSTDAGKYFNNFQKDRYDDEIGELFENILIEMDKRGMLTYKKDDPIGALGKFSD